MKLKYQLGSFLLLWVLNVSSYADNVDRGWEQRTSEKLAKEIETAEVLWLEAKKERFLALYTDQNKKIANGAVVILHAMGAHADWPQIIAPLRTRLPEHGWSTLAIQLPAIAPENQIEDYGATLDQAAARIETAISLLRERKFLNIAIIGQGFGAVTGLNFVQKASKQKVVSIVTLGLQDYAFVKPAIDVLNLIEKVKIPILDIYGSRDFRNVVQQAPDRRLAAKKGENDNYTQLEIEGADHHFNGMEDVLVKRIRGWLDKAAPGITIFVDEEETENIPSEP